MTQFPALHQILELAAYAGTDVKAASLELEAVGQLLKQASDCGGQKYSCSDQGGDECVHVDLYDWEQLQKAITACEPKPTFASFNGFNFPVGCAEDNDEEPKP